MQHQEITKKNIRSMLDRFYSQILKDDLIGEFFIEKLGDEMISDEWQTHLDLLTNFWASKVLDDTDYNGVPIKPHIGMKGLNRESFERWLTLFYESVDKYFVAEKANILKKHSEIIANDFMKILKI